MEHVYVGIGANAGDREANIRAALELLEARKVGRVLRCSSLLETEPWGRKAQPSFLNMVVEITTPLPPRDLLQELKGIETELGRRPRERWGPREIDLDILFYGAEVIDAGDLVIPHPRLTERRFVLRSLAELGPGLSHPGLGATMEELLAACTDEGKVSAVGRPTWRPCGTGGGAQT